MAQATYRIRMDSALKQSFDTLCEDFGMTATTAFNIFAKAVVRERRIPFEIASPEKKEYTRKDFYNAFIAARRDLQEADVPEMTLEEINEEIAAVRRGEAE